MGALGLEVALVHPRLVSENISGSREPGTQHTTHHPFSDPYCKYVPCNSP